MEYGHNSEFISTNHSNHCAIEPSTLQSRMKTNTSGIKEKVDLEAHISL